MKKALLIICILIPIALVSILFTAMGCSSDIPCVESEGYFKRWGTYYYQPRGSFKGDEVKVEGADARTFEIINSKYAKDKNHFYFGSSIVEHADPETVVLLDYAYLKDKNNVFYYGALMNDVDFETFETIRTHYAKDKNHVYKGADIIVDADPETFIFMGEINTIPEYAVDKNTAFYRGESIPDSEGISFQLLNDHYSKDKGNVYYESIIIEGADSASFELLDNDSYAKDSKYIYFQGDRITKADRNSFELLLGGFSKDKNNVYQIFYTDVSARKVVILEGVNPDFFEALNNYYAIDLEHQVVYCKFYETFENGSGPFNFKPIEGADIETFVVQGGVYAEDINFFYRACEKSAK